MCLQSSIRMLSIFSADVDGGSERFNVVSLKPNSARWGRHHHANSPTPHRSDRLQLVVHSTDQSGGRATRAREKSY